MSFRDTIHVEEDDGNEVGGAKVWKFLIVTFVAYTTRTIRYSTLDNFENPPIGTDFAA